MEQSGSRRIAEWLRRTPLHPQWLLDDRADTVAWIRSQARGIVLDIGCADRWIERELPETCRYVGVDHPSTGRDLYHAVPHVFADAGALPLPDASVDTVLLLEVMEHLRDPRTALAEIARVLRPQGRLLLTMPFLYPIHDAPHDFQRLTHHGLVRDIEAAGLDVDRCAPRLGSLESAGLIAVLSLGGTALRTWQRRNAGILLIPLLLTAIPLVNFMAWSCGKLTTPWDAITNGYRLSATRRPTASAG